MDIIPLVLVLAVFYFLIIRPQIREREAHEKLVKGLVKGDPVVIQSGLHGKIVKVAEETVSIEIAKNTHVKVDKMSVVRKLGGDGAAES